MDKIKFEVGDKVSWNGMLCTVIGNCQLSSDYPITVQHYDGVTTSFTSDGRLFTGMLEPSLKLITRAKKKVKPMPALISVWGRKRLEISEEVFNTLEEAEEFYREFECSLNKNGDPQRKLLAWPYIPGVTEIEE